MNWVARGIGASKWALDSMARSESRFSSNTRSAFSRFFPVLKLLLVLFGFGVVLFGASKNENQLVWTFDVGHSIIFLLVCQLSYLVFAVRMKYCLHCFGILISIKNSIYIHFQSIFYYFFVPMSIGLEVSRFIKIKKVSRVESSSILVLSLTVDRLLGLGSALVMAVVLLPFIDAADGLQRTEFSNYWYLVIAVPIIAIPFLWRRWSSFRLFLSDAVSHVRRNLWMLLALFVCSLFMNFLMGLALQHGALALGISLSLLVAVFSLCAASLALILPLSIAGFSGAELASIAIFEILGFSLSESVAIAFIGYLLRLLPAAQGGLIELFETIADFRRNRRSRVQRSK